MKKLITGLMLLGSLTVQSNEGLLTLVKGQIITPIRDLEFVVSSNELTYIQNGKLISALNDVKKGAPFCALGHRETSDVDNILRKNEELRIVLVSTYHNGEVGIVYAKSKQSTISFECWNGWELDDSNDAVSYGNPSMEIIKKQIAGLFKILPIGSSTLESGETKYFTDIKVGNILSFKTNLSVDVTSYDSSYIQDGKLLSEQIDTISNRPFCSIIHTATTDKDNLLSKDELFTVLAVGSTYGKATAMISAKSNSSSIVMTCHSGWKRNKNGEDVPYGNPTMGEAKKTLRGLINIYP